MPKIALELDLKQLEQIITRQLGSRDRLKLIRRLEQKTWGERFRVLVSEIDKRRKKYPISQKEIDQIVEEVRRERYEAGRRS